MPVFDSPAEHPNSLLPRGEKLYPPAKLAKAANVPGHRGAAHVNGSTLYRHITKGVRTASGEVIRLEAVRAGARWLSSVEALTRFYERLTAAELQAAEAAKPPTPPRERNRRQEAASRRLDSLLNKKG